jgi:hypothetical protein
MKLQKLMLYIGYTAGTIFVLLGIALLFTDLFPTHLSGSEQLKIVFGVVMILYGVYRIVILTIKNNRADEKEEVE